jgi:hypothetical protein
VVVLLLAMSTVNHTASTGTLEIYFTTSYQQSSTPVAAFQHSLSNIKQINSIFRWWKNDKLPIPFPSTHLLPSQHAAT